MDEPTLEVKKQIIEARLVLWRNTLYAAMADAKVAQNFIDAKIPSGETMLSQAKDEAKRCEVAITAYQQMLDGILSNGATAD